MKENKSQSMLLQLIPHFDHITQAHSQWLIYLKNGWRLRCVGKVLEDIRVLARLHS